MFTLELVTYKGVYRKINAQSCNLPTPDGRRGILPNRMPIMLPISIGVVSVLEEDNVRRRYTVSEGIFYIGNNRARARERLEHVDRDADIHRAEIALLKAINRIKAKESDS